MPEMPADDGSYVCIQEMGFHKRTELSSIISLDEYQVLNLYFSKGRRLGVSGNVARWIR
jgi:hypothetical protein